MPTPKSPPTPTADHDDFMNPEDAAKDIGCGVRWLRDGANHFGFPHDRYGKALWFSRQQREEIRRMNRVQARPTARRAKRKKSPVVKPTVPATAVV